MSAAVVLGGHECVECGSPGGEAVTIETPGGEAVTVYLCSACRAEVDVPNPDQESPMNTLCHYTTPIEEAREGITIEEARLIASEDAS